MYVPPVRVQRPGVVTVAGRGGRRITHPFEDLREKEDKKKDDDKKDNNDATAQKHGVRR